MVEDVPDFQPELSTAASYYSKMMHLRSDMDDLINDNFSEKAMQAIADPTVRRAYANTILQIRDNEQEAVNHIKNLIERCG